MVTVNLQDVNDNPPVFAEDVYTASVKESATTGTPVITITVRTGIKNTTEKKNLIITINVNTGTSTIEKSSHTITVSTGTNGTASQLS